MLSIFKFLDKTKFADLQGKMLMLAELTQVCHVIHIILELL